MLGKNLLKCLPFLLLGVYIIVKGLTAKSLIDESAFPATPEEKVSAKATPFRRILVIAVGLASAIYGIVCLSR